MRAWLTHRPLNERLAILAFVLALVAVFATPYRGGRAVVDANELAREVVAGNNRVAPLDLADWIIQGRSDVRLIDLRSDGEFQRYHIPTAENLPVERLAEAALGRQEKVVLYSSTDLIAAQAWLLLRSQGFTGVSLLEGSLPQWNEQVLSPVLPEDPTVDQARTARLKSICAFFGGSPRTGGRSIVAAAIPSIPPPGAVPAAPKTGGKAPAAKKKEGC